MSNCIQTQLNSKTLQVSDSKVTLTAPENEPFSVSTTRQKSSSSDVETFRRPACRFNVKCQQKCRTKHLLSLSKWADMFDFRRPRHVMKPRLASWKLVCFYMKRQTFATDLHGVSRCFFISFLIFHIPVDHDILNYVTIRWSSQAVGRDRKGLSLVLM